MILRYDQPTGYWVPVNRNGQFLRDFPAGENPSNTPNYQQVLEQYLKQPAHYGKSLVLLPDWAPESRIYNAGFSEAAADSFFASLVGLNQALGNDTLFKSPFHFIGFSRGTVVNSEIIQRLGTAFPRPTSDNPSDPNYANRSLFPDLQMTTIDPHDFDQPGLAPYSDFNEPKIQVWENVTYADNYFQTAANPDNSYLVPNGRDIPYLPNADLAKLERAELAGTNPPAGLLLPKQGWPLATSDAPFIGRPDVSVFLGTGAYDKDAGRYTASRAGFTNVDPTVILRFFSDGLEFPNPHGRALGWYSGTANLNSTSYNNNDITPIFRRLSDFRFSDLYDQSFVSDQKRPPNPWYTPQHLKSSFALGAEDAPWEGIGTGWFYSVLGGGFDNRLRRVPLEQSQRVPIKFDNTYSARMRGDYAVPTLFNGNFDATRQKDDPDSYKDQKIPGWTYSSNNSAAEVLRQQSLVAWEDIGSLERYRELLRYDRSRTNYALELKDGETITHSSFVVPEWGSLRFDLHTPSLVDGARLTVTLRDANGSPLTTEISLQAAVGGTGASGYEADRFRIGYGNVGFETFTINEIPEQLRGKVATVSFNLVGVEKVYLDNVFFISQNLLFGNPTEARATTAPVPSPLFNNFLLEKSQYATSFSGSDHIPNWSSWQLNKSWINPEPLRPRDIFFRDRDLANVGIISANGSDYGRERIVNPSYPDRGTPSYKLVRGHLAANKHRNRTYKDAVATYATSNIVPQHEKINSPIVSGFEAFLTGLANNGKEVFVVSGGRGVNPVQGAIVADGYNIRIPRTQWAVALVLDQPLLGVQDVNLHNATAFAVEIENTLPRDGTDTEFVRWNDGSADIITVSALEQRLNSDTDNTARSIRYNFFSSLPEVLSRELKSRLVTISPGANPQILSAPAISPHIGHLGLAVSSDDSIRHSSALEEDTLQTSAFEIGALQTSPFEIGALQPSFFEISSSQIASRQISSRQVGFYQSGISELGISQVSPIQRGVIQAGSSQISFSEVGIIQTDSPHVAISEFGSTQVALPHRSSSEVGAAQINTMQVRSTHINEQQRVSSEVSLSSSVAAQQYIVSNVLNHNDLSRNASIIALSQDQGQPPHFGRVVLSEDSRLMSRLSQTFVVPSGAKYLQFTLQDTELGTTAQAPPDAFEVALLDARTLAPLAGVVSGLSQTDSLLNLQANGQTYFGSRVSVPGLANGNKIDLGSPHTYRVAMWLPVPWPPSPSTCWASAVSIAVS